MRTMPYDGTRVEVEHFIWTGEIKMKWKDWDRNLKIRLFGEGTMNVLFWAFFPFMTIFLNVLSEKIKPA